MKYLFYITKNLMKLYILLIIDDEISGYIYLNKISYDTWEVVSVAAEKGFGHKMYDAAMDLIHPNYITPYRNKQFKNNIPSIYKNYIKRSDVLTLKIEKDEDEYIPIGILDDYWFNRKYKLKDKLHLNFELSDKTIQYRGLKYFNSKYIFNG